jgi:FkbM family methyltransferase
MPRRLLRGLAPSALIEISRARRLLVRSGLGGVEASLRAPGTRRLAEAAPLAFIPTQCLRNAQTVLDVGAHAGSWSNAVLRLLKPERLLALEPNPQVFTTLRKRLEGRPGVSLYQLAAGAKSGHAELQIARSSDFSSLLRFRPEAAKYYGDAGATEQTVDVEVARVDDLLGDTEEVTLFKIDVQGAELEVLEGSERTLQRTLALIIEVTFVPHYIGEPSFFQLDHYLRDRGFSLYSLAPPRYGADGRLLWADAVYSASNSHRGGLAAE